MQAGKHNDELTATEFAQLLHAARGNSEHAWTELYSTYAPRVLQFLRVQRVADADDVLGEVFVDVVRSLHTFTGGPNEFRSWLITIAANRARDSWRSGGKLQRTLAEAQKHHSDEREAATHEIVEAQEQSSRLVGMLQVLPPDQRAAIYMHAVLGMPAPEISKALDRRAGAVRMLLNRGLATLRTRINS